MPNNNLPPGWGNRDSSAKPNWGNPNNEPTNPENDITTDSDVRKNTENAPIPKEKITDNPKAEFTNDSSSIAKNEEIKKEPVEAAVSEQSVDTVQKSAEKTPGKSKAPVIVLSILLVIVIIAFVVFAFLYFTKENPEDSAVSVSNSISETTTESTITESTTSTTTITTSSAATSTAAISETTTTAAALLSADEYVGVWHMENSAESELTIHSIDSSTVTFSLWYYRLCSLDNLTAAIERNSAYFYDDEIEGILTFDDGSIRLYVTMSDIPGIPSQYEEVYRIRMDESVQYGNETQHFSEPYIIQVTNPELPIYDAPSYNAKIVGTITVNEKYTIVEEYVEDGQPPAYRTWGRLKSGLGWINIYDATIADDSFDMDETPNVWCPNCGYGFFTTGVGTEGFTCPNCGHNWLP